MAAPKTTAADIAAAISTNPTPEQIAAWEQEHGKIKQVEVDGLVVCFKQPNRRVVEAANQVLVKSKSPSKYADVILKNCQLNYIDETAQDDELYFALSARVDDLVTSKVASLKN